MINIITENGKTFEMNNVESTVANFVGHDETTKTLAIVFSYAPETVYLYENVSRQKHSPLLNAKSFGSHFHAHIRKDAAKYPFTKETFELFN